MANLDDYAGLTDKQESDDIAEQAAMWAVQLSADEPSCKKSLVAEFEQWQQRDSRHQQAAKQMQGFIQSVHTIAKKPESARNALSHVLATSQSSLLASTLKGATLSILLTVCSVIGLQYIPPTKMMADISTGTGEWQNHTLADGSQISLNSNSAIDINFDSNKRELWLISGEVKVNVYPDAQRPFIVSTQHGSIEALGTEFIVSYHATSTDLAMLESKTLVKTAQQQQTKVSHGLVVTAGSGVEITEQKLGDLRSISVKSLTQAWHKKQLVVQNQSLPEVLDEINRHRAGNIFYDYDKLQHLRVSAVLPLDDTEQALTLLMANYPQLVMNNITPYFVVISDK
jgi:transmembrane sensor